MRNSKVAVKHLWIGFATIIAAFAGVSIARADERAVIVAKVPFAFIVGDVRFPAGDYVIREESEPAIVEVQSADGQRSAFAVTIPSSGQAASRSELVFKKFDGQYFLARIEPDDGDEREIVLTPSIMAHEIAKIHDAAQVADTP